MADSRTREAYLDSMRRVGRVLQAYKNSKKSIKGLLHSAENLLEYTGHYVQIRTSPTIDPSIPEPWAELSKTAYETPRQQLAAEIDLFALWMEPSPAEEAARDAVFQQILDILTQTAPEAQAERFGSSVTGLAMPMSDVDIRLFPRDFVLPLNRNPRTTDPETRAFLKLLDRVQVALEDHRDFTLVVQHYGRFPLIGATHLPTGLSVQVVMSQDTSASREIVKRYTQTHPTLRALYAVVKTVLDVRGLADVWYGGLGSYAVFMLVAASLKHTDPKGKKTCLVDQLMAFLDFVARLNTDQMGLSVEPPRLFKKKSQPSRGQAEAAEAIPVSWHTFLCSRSQTGF